MFIATTVTNLLPSSVGAECEGGYGKYICQDLYSNGVRG
jgi:hypothetical protein